MKNLFKVEAIKAINYPTFWAILLLHALFYVLVVTLGANIDLNIQGINVFRLFSSNYMWGTMAWIASWFNLLLAILVIVLTGNELTYNTFRRQLLDGLNRDHLIVGKLITIASLSLYVVLLVAISGLIVGLTNTEPEPVQVQFFHGFQYVLILGIQSLAYMALAVFIALLFRNMALSIVMYLLYFILIEPFIRLFFSSNIDSFFPIKIISNLTPTPDFLGMLGVNLADIQAMDPNSTYQIQHSATEGISLPISIAVCGGYIVLFLVASRLIVKYRDL
ncbi:MAG: ABC transporter permease [Bacteroidales bacterium]